MSAITEPAKRLTPKIWKRDEILTFLDIFESTFHASVSKPFDSESDMWQCVSEKLFAEGGYTASAQHCQSKWNFLYKTYVNSQNHQGTFFAKIRQIVEYSQQVSLNTEAKSSDEATAETEINKHIDELEHDPDSEVQLEVETLEESEPIDTIEYSLLKKETSPQKLEQPAKQSFEKEQPTKKLKLEQEASVTDDAAQLEQLQEVTEPPQRQEQQQPHQKESTAVDLSSTLQSIVKKIDAIHEEQLSQGRRLEWMERLQLENRQTLLEIKNHLKMK